MKSMVQIAVLLLTLSFAARAENGVLVEHVPGGAEVEAVLAVVKQSLTYRRWHIEGVDASSVSASLDHMNYDAKIRILLSNGQILYEASAMHAMKTGPSARAVKRPANVPRRWIAFLRQDISAVVGAMPEKRE